MIMFKEVYDFSREMLAAKCFENWNGHFQSELEALFADGGPSDKHAKVLDSIRALLGNYASIPVTPDPPSQFKPRQPEPKQKPQPAKPSMSKPWTPSAEQAAGWLIEYAKASQKDPTKGLDMRAAFLKMLKHFYFVARAGNQAFWVVDHPTAYRKWTYDLFDGKSERTIKAHLAHNHEVFGEGDRKLFSEALTLARKWSMDVYAKMSAPDAKALELTKRWFGVGDDKVAKVAEEVKDGFKYIAQACNDTRVIFSDDPTWRTQGDAEDLASVYREEAMQVIYVYRDFLRLGKSDRTGGMPKLWIGGMVIIHELSHKRVGTRDNRYSYDGLKVGARFTALDAIWNADSWAFFAVDMVGALPQQEFEMAYRE